MGSETAVKNGLLLLLVLLCVYFHLQFALEMCERSPFKLVL
jgi:hypothetical protein